MNMIPERTKLLWVKLPEDAADKLASEARNKNISRADLMRDILVYYVENPEAFKELKARGLKSRQMP